MRRGFNQAELLAQHISRELDIPQVYGLKRIKNTRPQVELSPTKRQDNVKDAFRFFGDRSSLSGKTVLIVDDVLTTGATIDQAAKVLRKAGAKAVFGFVLAKR
jgi:ComF family protein